MGCALYVGKCCGFTKGMDESKAVQYLIDIVDTFEGGLNKAADSGPTLKEYLEGERFAKQVGNIDRSIKGPFYFGDSPTAPDFFLCNLLDWFDHMLLVRLKEEKGVDALGPFKKIQGVLNGIRNLESYSAIRAYLSSRMISRRRMKSSRTTENLPLKFTCDHRLRRPQQRRSLGLLVLGEIKVKS